jgi:outer membrane immunogenic protein
MGPTLRLGVFRSNAELAAGRRRKQGVPSIHRACSDVRSLRDPPFGQRYASRSQRGSAGSKHQRGKNMVRKSLLSTVALVALGGTAFAADLPSRSAPPVYAPPPPPPIFTWTGVYIGGDIGYRFGTASSAIFPNATGPSGGASLGNFNPGGVTGGGHIGYNYQVGQFVAGLEGDINGSSYHGSQASGPAFLSTNSDVDASIRGRVGVAWDRALVYATGGVAFAPFRNQYFLGSAVDSSSQTQTGWTIGGGIEYALTNNWSIRAEYRYTDYGHIYDPLNATTAGVSSLRIHETDNAVRLGFSYKFDMFAPPGPPVAKY